jgi:hypothetical protein
VSEIERALFFHLENDVLRKMFISKKCLNGCARVVGGGMVRVKINIFSRMDCY